MLKKILRKNRKEIALYTVAVFLIISVLYIVVAFVIQSNADNSQKTEITKTEERLVEAEQVIIQNKIDRLIADALFMADTLKYHEDNYDAEIVQDQWSDFSNRKRIYDQIRYLDANGNEVIRIDYDIPEVKVVEKDDLQNKKDRYYFEDTMEIDVNQVYISRVDLNMENGVVEEPEKPMIRFSTPVYDSSDVFQGIVILNYLAEDVLKQVENIAETGVGKIFVCNEDSYWIYNGVDHDLEWAFMYEDTLGISFENQFPEEWQKILDEKSGTFITENGAFSFTNTLTGEREVEATDDIVLGEGDWYIISYIAPDTEGFEILFQDTGTTIWNAMKRSPFVFLLLFVIAFIAALALIFNKVEQDEIKYFSEYDAMTGVYNRRAGFDKLHRVYEMHSEDDVKISICFIDVNGLKEVNDNFGHDDGDELLQTIVNVIKNNIREQDFVARFGGDEFVVIFEDLSMEAAELVWKRIADEYDRINKTEKRKYLVSASHGIETLVYGEAIDDTVNRADEKMYEEKRRIKENIKIIR